MFAFLLLLVVGAGAAAVAGWHRAYSLDRSLTQARSESAQNRKALDQAQAKVRVVEALQAEVERLQRETKEIHRLRAQYQEWQRVKSDYEQLQKKHAALQQSQQALTRSVQEARKNTPRPMPTSWVGIAMDTSYQGGAKVQSVAPGSPAAKVDIAANDIIIAADGRQITGPADLRSAIAAKKVGQNVTLSLQRGGQLRTVVLRTTTFPR
jgi:C-terminal processing protease CtpA/Prc